MIALIEQHKNELVALCRRHGVQTLDLFGSAATGAFDDNSSDIDFVIDFLDYGPGIARRFFDFTSEAEALLGRPVDLVFDSEMRNPYFLAEVNATRQPLYDANRDSEAAA